MVTKIPLHRNLILYKYISNRTTENGTALEHVCGYFYQKDVDDFALEQFLVVVKELARF